jgi:hypothetical protein
MTMISAHRATQPEERPQAFRARHAAYCVPIGGKPPLMICRARSLGEPHDAFDKSPRTLLRITSATEAPQWAPHGSSATTRTWACKNNGFSPSARQAFA